MELLRYGLQLLLLGLEWLLCLVQAELVAPCGPVVLEQVPHLVLEQFLMEPDLEQSPS